MVFDEGKVFTSRLVSSGKVTVAGVKLSLDVYRDRLYLSLYLGTGDRWIRSSEENRKPAAGFVSKNQLKVAAARISERLPVATNTEDETKMVATNI